MDGAHSLSASDELSLEQVMSSLNEALAANDPANLLSRNDGFNDPEGFDHDHEPRHPGPLDPLIGHTALELPLDEAAEDNA